jgi:diguanylate cyclase (GGDEF)-like protein
VASLTEAEVDRIYRKQITIRPHRRFDYRPLVLVLLGMAVVFGSAIIWHRKVGRLKKRIATAKAELAAKDEQINRMAITDPLTCLNNRMRLIDILGKETQRFHRYGHPTSIIFSDVDHFKDINETFGYNLGDVVLCKMGEILESSIRKADICGRWGGEKFMVICPETEMEGALILAEHLRSRIESLSLPKVGTRTCSFGVASFLPGDTEESIVQRADKSQNLAKEKGGNRVETAE